MSVRPCKPCHQTVGRNFEVPLQNLTLISAIVLSISDANGALRRLSLLFVAKILCKALSENHHKYQCKGNVNNLNLIFMYDKYVYPFLNEARLTDRRQTVRWIDNEENNTELLTQSKMKKFYLQSFRKTVHCLQMAALRQYDFCSSVCQPNDRVSRQPASNAAYLCHMNYLDLQSPDVVSTVRFMLSQF
ncbi:hypothetical protein FF38_03997 [Lucilia cuprina]|uniref:Uncharacterized protein n=1 Tax=Lucilia cuprina TaxID=7375 RepID=A0A0L0BNV9_LUCCU|nr:hypothetical protein FF38_03997 [Lucilia cuprina]